jgi:hypothetical protein
LIKEFNIKTVEDPTTGQFIDVLNLIGLTEKQFRKDPEKALERAKNLDLEESQKLLELISTDKIDLREYSLDVAIHVVGIAASFFLAESLESITKQKLTESGYMNPKAYQAGSRAEKIMGLTLASQLSDQPNMQKSGGGN